MILVGPLQLSKTPVPVNDGGRVARSILVARRTRHEIPSLALVLAAWLLTACAPAVTPEPVVEVGTAEIALARVAYAETLGKFRPYEDAAIQRYVQTVGARLAAGAPHTNVSFRFAVLDCPGVFAFSFADGQVVVSRGTLIYLNTEAQLAAVLGHEIGHVVSLHQARAWREIRKARELEARLAERFSTRQARDALGALGLARVRGYSREYEIEADMWSERLLKGAGYDPAAMAQVLRFFVQQENFANAVGFELWDMPDQDVGGRGVLATHPSPATRLDLAIQRLGGAARAAATPDPAYLNALRGIVFGLAERYGVQRGTRYIHSGWRIALSLPGGWYVFGTGDTLAAAPGTNDGLLIIRTETGTNDQSPHGVLQKLALGRTLGSPDPIRTASATGETTVASPTTDGGSLPVRLAVLDVDGRRISFVGLAALATSWNDIDKQFRSIVRSTRALTPAEPHVAPLRLQIEQARSDQAPAAGSFATHARERGELLNQLYPDGRTMAGQWVKTVR